MIKMLKRKNVCKWLMLITFVSLFLHGSASADDSELNDSEYNEISDSSMQEFANDSSFIAYRGTLPETIDQKWENSIVNCWLNLTRIGPSYSEFDSSIKSIGSNNKIIIIKLESAYKGKVNDSRINEIYQKIDDYCERQEGISEIPVVFMWAHDEENLPLPDYGPQIFEEVKKESGFIATRGKMPVITDANEKVEWTDLLVKYSQPLSRPNSAVGIYPYFVKFGGPVNSFGADIHGYLIVSFEPSAPEKVNESIIDKIYQVIDDHFEQEGISDVPVVFAFVQITDDLASADESDVNESNDINLSNSKEKIVGNETTNQTPGFTSTMAILELLSLLVFKRLM
ncbi:MAG TPA: hypothetical protein VGK06_01995 [Methanosarcina sp.]|jgi:hypothetical protein